MTQDPLKAGWNKLPGQEKTSQQVAGMLKEAAHPVLKPIRRQLLLESVGCMLFLFVYYDFFDGHDKSLTANIALVLALVLAISHNLYGYFFARNQGGGSSLREAVFIKAKRLRSFAVFSVLSRVLISAGFLYFFLSVIQLDEKKSWLLLGGMVVVLVQLILLSKIWSGRVRQVQELQAELEG